MGWHPIGPERQGIGGDEAIDAMARATGRITEAYLERFGRAPLLAEVLHALRIVLLADPELIDDPERIESDFPQPTFPATAPPALDAYEASFREDPQPDGTHTISERGSGREVVTCRLRLVDRTLFVDYAINDYRLDDAEAKRLINWVLLREHTGDYYRALADRISFASAKAPDARTVVAYG